MNLLFRNLLVGILFFFMPLAWSTTFKELIQIADAKSLKEVQNTLVAQKFSLKSNACFHANFSDYLFEKWESKSAIIFIHSVGNLVDGIIWSPKNKQEAKAVLQEIRKMNFTPSQMDENAKNQGFYNDDWIIVYDESSKENNMSAIAISPWKGLLDSEGYKVEYYPNKVKKQKFYVENEEIQGLGISYFMNGQKKCVIEYKNNLFHGVFLEFDSLGNTLAYFYFQDGLKEGKQVKFVYKNNQLVNKEIEHYKGGVLEGEYGWYEVINGKLSLRTKMYYTEGVRNGEYAIIDENGFLQKGNYYNDLIVGDVFVYKNTNLVDDPINNFEKLSPSYKIVVENGAPKEYYEILPDGTLKKEED